MSDNFKDKDKSHTLAPFMVACAKEREDREEREEAKRGRRD